ncbi:type II toxin-antitoxin system prevent-host-death family antitoxin [Jiangella gansuensis]|uniref:type II toxin-antitoxin system prevent-host-death family antitoxin n=1 Tax=Jiangella gansuensis TaxID=281473 RepID=UPI00055CA803|nr:type II toxin-antitoxin system prevent-host-death family antitoxin [Jiangella gansuensis]
MEAHWQVQEAKQRLSELLRKVADEGPQFVTRHGEEVAVVIDIVRYRELIGVDVRADFKHALTSSAAPSNDVSAVLDEIVAERALDLPRDVDLAGRA